MGSGSSCGVPCGHLGTVGGLREAGRAIWALLREMDTHFLDEFTFQHHLQTNESGKICTELCDMCVSLFCIKRFVAAYFATTFTGESANCCSLPNLVRGII